MEKRKKYLEWLGFIAAATFIICFVAMIFFRIEPLRKGLKSILHILMPFIYGAVIAYLLKPVSLFFEKCLQKLNRNDNPKAASLLRMASILLSLLFFLVIIFLLMVAVVPGMASSITTLVRSMNSYVNQFQEWLEGYAQTEYGKEIVAVLEQGLETLTDRLQSWLKGDILPNLTSYITRVTDSFSVLFDILKNFGLGMIVAVYLMNGWEKFGAQAKMIVYAIFPKKAAEWIQYEIHYTDRMFSGFIHGKILDSAIVGIICFIFTMFTGMPYALLVSVIVGVTNIIPFFGPYMGMIPSALLILTSSPWKCLVFLVFIILLQQVDGNVLGPRILGETVGISSFWILFSILFFGSIWGLVGMIVGVPLFAVIYDLISRGVSNLLRKRRQETMLDKYTERFHPEKAAVKNKTSGGKAARRKNKTTEDRTNNNQSR